MALPGPRGDSRGPTIYPFPWPKLARVKTLADFLQERRRTIFEVAQALPEEFVGRPEILAEVETSLVERFRLDQIILGATAINVEVGDTQVWVTDPLMMGSGEVAHPVRVDRHTALIPFGGDERLLSLWPSRVQEAEPTKRAWIDSRAHCMRIPAQTVPRDPSNLLMKKFLLDQDRGIRRLVTATNADINAWNTEIPGIIRSLVHH